MTLGHGHLGLVNLALLLAAAAGTVLFMRVEARAPSPLVRLAMFRDLVLSAGFATSAIVSTVVMATLVVGPFYLARSLGLSTAVVGLVMSAGPAAAALVGVPGGRTVDRFGTQRTTLVGLAGMVLGCSALGLVPATLGIVGYVAPLVVVTASYALFQTANNTAVMAEVPADRRGVVSGLLTLSRNLGLITGASVMGALFALASRAGDLAAADPGAVATGARVTFGVAAGLVAFALVIARRSHGPARRHEATSA